MSDNLRFYKAFGQTPKEAQKTIAAGKLKGMTDVNPMWRIKALTEKFGPQGIGWKLEIVNMWTTGNADSTEVVAWCHVNLCYREDNGEWSAPVPGIGGSKLLGKGVGDGANDEAYKMAFTDAISIACKGLGMCADIYFAKDRTKYDAAVSATTTPTSKKEEAQAPEFVTDPEQAMKDFAACTTKEQVVELYNTRYGGNNVATPAIKKIVLAAVTRVDNQ